jgi:hypothetical protein
MTVKFNSPFTPKVMPKIEDLPGAKPVDLKKHKRTASGELRREPAATSERQKAKVEVEVAVERAIKTGEIVVREKGAIVDTTDPELREHFGRMLFMGATQDLICEVLKIQRDTYRRLKRLHLESVVESLAETGVMGMVALSFDKMEMASTKTLQLINSLGVSEKDRADLIGAVRLLKDIENDKVSMLVKTGAIKVKKRAEISAHLEVLSGSSQPLLTGEKAQQVMVRVMADLVDAIEDDDESDGGEESD